MIKSYDWMIYAQNHPDFKEQIENIIATGKKLELNVDDTYRLTFNGEEKTVTVRAHSDMSPFHEKIVPMKIAYRSVTKMINGDWDNLCKEDFKEIGKQELLYGI